MNTPQNRLDQLITDVQNGKPVTPENEEEQFAADLALFAQSFDYQTPQPRKQKRLGTSRLIMTLAASITLLTVIVFSVPSVRAFAMSILDPLFPPTDDEEITITYNEFDDEDVVYFDTLADMAEYTAFDLLTLVDLPNDLEDAFFEYNTVRNVTIQWYNSHTRLISISQQPLASAETNGLLAFSFDLEIPEEARIEDVQVGDQTGKLVHGMWVTNENSDPRTYRWSDNFWYFTLRWQDDTMVYEVMLYPVGDRPPRDEMVEEIIALANDLTLAQ